MEPTHSTAQGRTRDAFGKFTQHVCANRLTWYIALVVTFSLGLMLGGVGRG